MCAIYSPYIVIKNSRKKFLSLRAKQNFFNNEIFTNYGTSLQYIDMGIGQRATKKKKKKNLKLHKKIVKTVSCYHFVQLHEKIADSSAHATLQAIY